MNESIDPLEAELAALKPHEASSPLRRRIERQLTDLPARSSRRRWRLALAGGLLAASLLAAVVAFGPWHAVVVEDPSGETKLASDSPKESPLRTPREWASAEFPTLLVYRQALARSPEDLDALLDEHSRGDPPATDSSPPPNTFLRSDVEVRSWIGGL